MEGRLEEHLEDKLFFHYPHLDNSAKDYSWIAALVVFYFMVVVVVVVVVIAVVVKAYSHRHTQPSAKDLYGVYAPINGNCNPPHPGHRGI